MSPEGSVSADGAKVAESKRLKARSMEGSRGNKKRGSSGSSGSGSGSGSGSSSSSSSSKQSTRKRKQNGTSNGREEVYKNYALKGGVGITPYHFGAVAIAKETVDGVADGTAMLDADIFNYGMATMIDDNFQSAQSVAAVTCYFATTAPGQKDGHNHLRIPPGDNGLSLVVPWLCSLHFSLFVLVMKPRGELEVYHVDSCPGIHKLEGARTKLNRLLDCIRSRDPFTAATRERRRRGAPWWKIESTTELSSTWLVPKQVGFINFGLHALVHAKNILSHVLIGGGGGEMALWKPPAVSQGPMERSVQRLRQDLVKRCRDELVLWRGDQKVGSSGSRSSGSSGSGSSGSSGSGSGSGTSCAIRGARGRNIGHRSPPGSSEELGWAGCGPGGPTWPLGRWVRWPVTPTGTGAGSSAPPPYRQRATWLAVCRRREKRPSL